MMSDVLIRGMEAPERCDKCDFSRWDREYEYEYCARDPRRLRLPLKKPGWCPLVALPEGHGRLIDADVLREDWLENGENEYVYDTNAFLNSLDNATTIVPAEKERDTE